MVISVQVGGSGRRSVGGAGRPRPRYPQPHPSRAANPLPAGCRPAFPSRLSAGGATVGAAEGVWAGRQQPGRRGARREANAGLAQVGTPPVVRGRPARCRHHPGHGGRLVVAPLPADPLRERGHHPLDPADARVVDRAERRGGHDAGRRPGLRRAGVPDRRGRRRAHRLRLPGQHRPAAVDDRADRLPARVGDHRDPGVARRDHRRGRAAAPGGHVTGGQPATAAGSGQAAAGTPATSGGTATGNGPPRAEVVLRASTGHKIRAYPAAQFGGAVAASPATTVVVGPRAVTSYANHTGAVRWSRPTGAVPQAWQVDGGELYMAVASGGYLGSAPVTALRRINLGTGAQHVVRSHGPSFLGALSLAYRGVVVFSSPRMTRGYSATTGRELWHYPSALPDTVDAVAGRLYLISGNTLIGVNPQTGSTLARVNAASSSGLYGSRA